MKRPIRIEGDVAYVPLTRGYEAVIDAADVPLVDGFNWSAKVNRRKDGSIRTVYAFRMDLLPSGKKRMVMMHRIIAGTPNGFDTDHRDGDGRNNRRSNLRTATKAQNQHNARTRADNTSGARGVSWNKGATKWEARIMLGGIRHSLGLFKTVEAAASAYARGSAELHGEFGRVA